LYVDVGERAAKRKTVALAEQTGDTRAWRRVPKHAADGELVKPPFFFLEGNAGLEFKPGTTSWASAVDRIRRTPGSSARAFKLVMNGTGWPAARSMPTRSVDQREKFFFGEGAQLPPTTSRPAARALEVRGRRDLSCHDKSFGAAANGLGRGPGTLESAGFSNAAKAVSVGKLSARALSRARLLLIEFPCTRRSKWGASRWRRQRAPRPVGFFGMYAT